MPLERLKAVVGEGGWSTDPAELEPHLTEWRDSYRGKTPIMLRPGNTAEVAEIVSICAETGTPLVPQGGNTGLCGGAIPDGSGKQVLLSLARLNRIRSVLPDDYSMIAEAGCVLADLQRAAAAADRLLPLSLAAEGSCQIGGNVSTNAGGTNVLRYGTARDLVLGLEVVLPDGTVWDGLRSLRKDTAGYDIKQLFIGAEGTLGVITAVSIKLFPRPPGLQTAFLSMPDAQSAIELLARLRGCLSDRLQAFELISDRAMRYALRHIPGLRSPVGTAACWYVLLESAESPGETAVEAALADALDAGLATDAVLAKNSAERDQMWRLRHSLSEAQKREGASLKHDVSVPVGEVARFIGHAERRVLEIVPASRVVAFGHVGDGNIHFNVSQPASMAAAEFLALRERVAAAVYDVVQYYRGSISAEHGIGVLKREALMHYRSETELRVMRALKQALDPDNLMNPGKVL
ncbi:MAG: FAD-binding oxidoreductase [Gammaproteobacteria bacterium]|nr:FAD-binding oxidoreductase [Gammaproteobacteria bacterium]